jgi:hypothetical protein
MGVIGASWAGRGARRMHRAGTLVDLPSRKWGTSRICDSYANRNECSFRDLVTRVGRHCPPAHGSSNLDGLALSPQRSGPFLCASLKTPLHRHVRRTDAGSPT